MKKSEKQKQSGIQFGEEFAWIPRLQETYF